MIKKFITYIFLVNLIFSSFGLTIFIHHCDMMNESSLSTCNMCVMEDSGHDYPIVYEHDDYICCETKLYSLKTFDDSLLKLNEFKQILSVISFSINFIRLPQDNFIQNLTIHDNSPPVHTPIFIKYSSLLI